MRGETTPEKIELLMRRLGQEIRAPGRVYFTGGVSALLFGWRSTTVDVDFKADPEPTGFFEALPQIKEALDINLELASPEDFIPSLPGWRDRSRFIARHGQIDLFVEIEPRLIRYPAIEPVAFRDRVMAFLKQP